jgi:hypothetical protein
MELKIKIEELRKNKVFIATPMYGGMANGLYVKSILDLQGLMTNYGVQTKFSFLFNESLITRARNYLVDEFLRSEEYTHLLFLDSDVSFDPQDIVALLALDKDVIGAPYPKKSINWKNIANALRKDPTLDHAKLEGLVGDYVFNAVPGTKNFNVTEPLEVMEIGTGYMLVKREVFAKFKETYPHLNYRPDHKGQANFDGSRYIHAYFDTVIDNGYTIDDIRNLMVSASKGEDVKELSEKILGKEESSSHRYLSEDYMFCQYWRKPVEEGGPGGQIWLCPWMKTSHVGTYPFSGDMPAIANLTGML